MEGMLLLTVKEESRSQIRELVESSWIAVGSSLFS